jgi:hypothetical protein
MHVSVPSERESSRDVPASQVAAHLSAKATKQSTRHTPEADLPRTERRITPGPFNESPERFCLGFSCIDNYIRSLYSTTQISHDIAVSIQALSPQNQNGTETSGIALNHPIDGLHYNGNSSRLRLDGEFLENVGFFTVDRTISHPPHIFNGIEVMDVGRSVKIGPGDCDADCIESFFRLLCSMG